MFTQIKVSLSRSAPTLAQDAAGVAALAVLLMAGLYLPLFL